jgi:hypothetical protein
MGESRAQAADESLWRFKQNGLVFGPVPGAVLLEKLDRGEIGPDTEVAREEEERFRALRDVATFTLEVAKAEAKLRVAREASSLEAKERSSRRTRRLVIGCLVVSSVGLAAGGAYWVVERRQHDLASEVDDVPITPNPPELAAAASDADVSVPVPGTALATRRPGRSGPSGQAPRAPGAQPSQHEITAARYDKGSIIQAEVHQKGSLIPCIREELHRSDFRGDIRFTVAVGNDGHVAKLWMDDDRFRESPLQGCFWSAMSRWHFASYEGERATLSDSFHVGK